MTSLSEAQMIHRHIHTYESSSQDNNDLIDYTLVRQRLLSRTELPRQQTMVFDFYYAPLSVPIATPATTTTTSTPPTIDPAPTTTAPRLSLQLYPLFSTSRQHRSTQGLMSILSNAFSNPGITGGSLFDPFDAFDASADDIINALHTQFANQPTEAVPIPSSIFDSFPKMKHEKLDDYMASIAPEKRITVDTECTICKCDYEPNSTVVVLPECQHHFDEKCIKKWLTEMHYQCPTCRHSYAPDSGSGAS